MLWEISSGAAGESWSLWNIRPITRRGQSEAKEQCFEVYLKLYINNGVNFCKIKNNQINIV